METLCWHAGLPQTVRRKRRKPTFYETLCYSNGRLRKVVLSAKSKQLASALSVCLSTSLALSLPQLTREKSARTQKQQCVLWAFPFLPSVCLVHRVYTLQTHTHTHTPLVCVSGHGGPLRPGLCVSCSCSGRPAIIMMTAANSPSPWRNPITVTTSLLLPE